MLREQDFPAYFRALQERRVLPAADAAASSLTGELYDAYLKPLGITSMLDAPVFVNGQLVAVVCHEHVGPQRRWQAWEELVAGTFAEFAGLVLEAKERPRAPDGRSLAYGSVQGVVGTRVDFEQRGPYRNAALVVADVADDGTTADRLTVDVGDGMPPPCPVWAPDGERVAFGVPRTSPINPTRSGKGSEVWIVRLVDRHVTVIPDLLATDRGLATAANDQLAREAGVKRVAMPCLGRASPERRRAGRSRRFRRDYRLRAGIEGRIHVLRRDFGLKRRRYHGQRGLGRWVGWGIVTHNLSKIAEAGANG